MRLFYVPFDLRSESFFSTKVCLCTQTLIWTWMYWRCTDLFSRESCNMKQRQQTMLSFLSTAEKSWRETCNNNFRKKSWQILHVVPDLKVTIKQYSEAEMTTISVAVAASAWWMRRQSFSWNVTHYGLDCTKCIFKKRLKEVLTKKSLQQHKCWEIQTQRI